MGRTNWRLKGLKEAIRADRLPTFEGLAAMTSRRFYGPGRGDHYAMARYYLQEKGRLRRYSRRFHDAREDDPTGYDTLVALRDEDDMAAFQRRWQEWVLDLEYP